MLDPATTKWFKLDGRKAVAEDPNGDKLPWTVDPLSVLVRTLDNLGFHLRNTKSPVFALILSSTPTLCLDLCGAKGSSSRSSQKGTCRALKRKGGTRKSAVTLQH
eukprot:876091-Amorphochlora_amoeboformis.AAC.1